MSVDGPVIVDASVFGAAFFNETRSEDARGFLAATARIGAPDLVFIEIASLSAKKVWRGEAPLEAGRRALAVLADFIPTAVPAFDLSELAFELAAKHRFSAYDATYLALATRENAPLVTLDGKLVERARQAGVGRAVLLT